MASVLYYNLPTEKRMKLLLICTRLRIFARPVARDQYDLPLGSLCGLSGESERRHAEPFEEEMLVFCEFDGDLLDRFLKEMRASKMQTILLKAVLTPTNLHWTSSELCRELKREHDAIHKRPNN